MLYVCGVYFRILLKHLVPKSKGGQVQIQGGGGGGGQPYIKGGESQFQGGANQSQEGAKAPPGPPEQTLCVYHE